MKKEKFFDDQPIFRGDLERSQNTKEDAIRERLLDLANPGVIRGSQLLGESSSLALVIGPAVGLYVTLNTGVAISPLPPAQQPQQMTGGQRWLNKPSPMPLSSSAQVLQEQRRTIST